MEQARQRQPAFATDDGKIFGRRKLHGDAGEVLAELFRPHAQDAARRIVNDRTASADGFEHHEVVHIPVQDRRQL